jgi:hypothetical protein
VLRINMRYLTEFVETFNVCPFARGARESGAVERRVLMREQDALPAIGEIAAHEQIVIGLLIFPRFTGGFEAFDALTATLREAHGKGPFALAPFHPDAPYGVESPARMMMFFRRAPDPTIQLVRFSALDAVKGARPDKFLFDWSASAFAELERRKSSQAPSERIAQDNFDRAQGDSFTRLQAVLADIRADRDKSYGIAGSS